MGKPRTWRPERAALRVPDDELDRLPVCRVRMSEALRRLLRQAIREHLEEQADPALRQAVEGGRRGRPRAPTSWLEHELFMVLSGIGPEANAEPNRYHLADEQRYKVIAATCTALGHRMTGKRVKDRLAAARAYARRHPGGAGPPVHTGVSASAHAAKLRKNIARFSPRSRR